MSAARVLVTGAAGQIAYSLVFLVARGEMLGDRPVILHLLDIPPMAGVLDGVVMELKDCAFPLLHGIVSTTDPEVAFKDIDYCLMVGAFPRKDGMERKDLLKANAGIFATQGKFLNTIANKNVKVVVVGNPANTNALLAMHSAPDLPRENFSALTRLDHNRARSQIAEHLKLNPTQVKNVCIWGNHSSTQYPDVNHATADGKAVREAVADDAYLNDEFIKTVQQRGAAVIKARKLSSAASAAKAIIDHMHDWIFGTPANEFVSMAVCSDGSYGVEKGLIYSFPVTCKDGKWSIVQGLKIDEFSQGLLKKTEKELIEEKEQALEFIHV